MADFHSKALDTWVHAPGWGYPGILAVGTIHDRLPLGNFRHRSTNQGGAQGQNIGPFFLLNNYLKLSISCCFVLTFSLSFKILGLMPQGWTKVQYKDTLKN